MSPLELAIFRDGFFMKLACPAGVEPATYGLEGLKNLQRQCLTITYLG